MKIICKDSTEVIVEIPEGVSKIGVMLSGGMDSSLLLYLLLKEITDNKKNINLTVFNVPNVLDNAIFFSKRVVNYLEDYFSVKLELINIGDGTLAHNKIIRTPSREIEEKKYVEKLFVGINQNPPVEFPISGPWRRDPDSPIPPFYIFPFIRLYKNHILEMYEKYNIMELCYLTHSCTMSTGIRCNNCFQCYERAWAFEQLNIKDDNKYGT
jgi:hypothetical protein